MAKKLLEKLGLRRRRETPVVVQNPVHGQQIPVNQNPQQPPQQQQPPPQQQPPQNAPWQAPVRNPQQPPQQQQQPQPNQPSPLGRGRVLDAERKLLEKKLGDSMPEIRQAKQLALTIDGKRIEANKTDSTSELTRGLTDLSSQMQAWVKTLDQHSSVVRKKSEEQDYKTAGDEIDKAVALAQRMMAQENPFHAMLAKGQIELPTELSGDFQPTPEFYQVRDEAEKQRPAIEEALAIKSDNPTVLKQQARCQQSLDLFDKKYDRRDFATAGQALDDATEAAGVVFQLAKAADNYEAGRSELEQTVQSIAALEPTPQIKQARQQVLDDFKASREQAQQGQFGEASKLLEKVRTTAQTAFSAESLLAKTHDESLANVMPGIDRALAVQCTCQPIGDLQKELTTVKGKLQQADREHRYDDARAFMEVGSQQANTILRLASSWDDYVAAEEEAQPIIAAALKLKPTKSDQLKQLKSIKTGQETAAKQAMQGSFKSARETLATTVSTAESLLGAVGSPGLAEFYKEFAADQKYLDTAAGFQSTLKIITDEQDSLSQARGEVQQSLQGGDLEGAEYMHSICMTRAALIHQSADRAEAFERAKKTYQPTFDAALKADGQIPGVSDAQQTLQRELTAANAKAQSDPPAATKEIHEAARTAHLILGVVELHAKQKDRHGNLKTTLDQVKKSYLPGGMADQLSGQQGLKDGKEFDAVLAAMKLAEGAKTDTNLDALAKAAGDWLNLYNAMTPEQQGEDAIKRRKQICETALKQAKHLKMASKLDQAGRGIL